MSTKLVIDSSSLINFLRYYYFDKNDENTINRKLYNFILNKIVNKEIYVIDKVYNELNNPETILLKKEIRKVTLESIYLFPKVEDLIKEHYIKSNEKYWGNDILLIEPEIHKYQDKYADLYLIALCLELLGNGNNVVLICEETLSRDDKLIKKIPTICRKENIECRNLPYMLFTIYKTELVFSLEIKN